MSQDPELIFAQHLDGKGGSNPIDWPAVSGWTPDTGTIWIHLDGQQEAAETWLREQSGLTTFVVDGLLANETRPRCEAYADGVLLILRGVNLNPGAEPEDMVSVRIWIEPERVISTRLRRLMAIQDIDEQLAAGRGPVSAGHLVARLAARLTDRMGPVIEALGDQVADLEDRLVATDDGGQLNLRELRHILADLRRVAISLRRYIAPQRDALNQLSQTDAAWLDDRIRGRLRETVDRVTRITEELDEVRERASVIQDELANRLSQRMEQTMYVLTVVATIMLPLGFLTGLLGINVGGIPGTETPWAFWAVCFVLAALAAVEIWLLRRLKWL